MRFIAIILALVACSSAQESGSGSKSTSSSALVALDSSREEIINLAPLMPTTLSFKTKERFGKISGGSDIVHCEFDRAAQTLDVTPQVESGRTAINMIIGKSTYTFVFIIDKNAPTNYRRTFTTVTDSNEDSEDYSAAENARALNGGEIDTVKYIKTITRAHSDRTFLASLQDFYVYPIGKPVMWNDCVVTLVEVNYFAAQDCLVFKMEWYNSSDAVLYLDEKQIEITAAGKPVRVTTSQQLTDKLYPSQMDTKWFFIQGYHIKPKNDWSFRLPPDSKAVMRLLRSK